MGRALTDDEFADLFEETWQAAELAAASEEDRHFASGLLELADEILSWRNQHGTQTSSAFHVDPEPSNPTTVFQKAPPDLENWQVAGHRYRHAMERWVARQEAILQRLSHTANPHSVELGRGLLQTMQEALEMARRLTR